MDLELFRHYVLALMLVDKKFLNIAQIILKPSYMSTEIEQHVARFILEHFRETRTAPDLVCLLDRAKKYIKSLGKGSDLTFKEFREFFEELFDLGETAAEQYVYVKNELVKFCKDEAMKEAIVASVDDLEKGHSDKVKKRIDAAMLVGSGLEGAGVFLFRDADKRKKLSEIRKPIPTGFKFIDGPSKGGLGRGELGILIAPPNTGKTTALVNIGAGAAKLGAKVAHLSCEMEENLVLNMYERCWLKKTSDDLDNLDEEGRSLVTKFFNRMQKTLKNDISVKSFPSNRLTIEGIYGHLLMLESVYGFKPDLLIVDYLDILAQPTHISKDKWTQDDWWALELRALANDRGSGLWTASQTGRGALQKETANNDDVGGGFTKTAHADIVITLNQSIQEQKEDLIRAFWSKNRVGKKYSTFTLSTDFDRARLEPV